METQDAALRVAVLSNVIMFLIFGYLAAMIENASYIFSKGDKLVSNVMVTGFPIFSIGAFSIIGVNRWLKPLTKNWIVHFLAYGSVATLIELVAGLLVNAGPDSANENGAHTTWDYSNQKFNYKGIISLKHFVAWGLLGIVAVKLYDWLLPQLKIGLGCIMKHNKQLA